MNETVKTTGPMLIGKHHDITPFASSDPRRFAINGVHYNAEKKLLEATDGKMAIRVPVCEQAAEFPPVKAGDDTLRDCIIPTSAIRKGLANAKEAGNSNSLPVLSYARLSANGDNKATLATTDLGTEQAVTARCVAAQFPGLDQVWPTAVPTLTIALSSTLLKRIATYAEAYGVDVNGDGTSIKLEFIDGLAPVRFSFHLVDPLGEKPLATGVIMPMRFS